MKKTYDSDTFSNELNRLKAEQLTYLNQTNYLYYDEDSFCNGAYVALADWDDRYEYAIIDETQESIIYVYLENMKEKDIYMEDIFLPSYFQNDNASTVADDVMTAEHRSFYAFQIGEQYVDCMDLVD